MRLSPECILRERMRVSVTMPGSVRGSSVRQRYSSSVLLILKAGCARQCGLVSVLSVLHLVLPFATAAERAVEDLSGVDETQGVIEQKCCTTPSISALHVNHHEPTEQEVMRAQIELSPYGLRVRESGKQSSQEMLQNFQSEQAWLIDYERRVFHELPLTAEPDVPMLPPGAGASFLGNQPCGDLKVTASQSGLWRGRAVDEVHCVDGDDVEQSVELLDHEYDIVVYRRDRHGYVDELQDFQDRSFTPEHFFPPEKFRAVGKKEFFFGSAPLRAYTPSR